ncbi:unnamed protein product [Cunninghamella blakesleeana]
MDFDDPTGDHHDHKETLHDLARKIHELNERVQDILREQQFQKEREAEFRDLSESTNSRIVWWTVLQIIVLGVVCVWQMRHFKSFFVAKKLTNIANGRVDLPFDIDLEQLSALDQNAINHVWSLFSAAPQKQRNLILKGILSVCCMPQLSFIYESLQPLLRIDFVLIFPKDINFQIFSYLDHKSLCQAAQVSRQWKCIADDERLWHKMCNQHIGNKCLKCGWGLSKPILLNDHYSQQQQQQLLLQHHQQKQSFNSFQNKKKRSLFSNHYFHSFPKKRMPNNKNNKDNSNDNTNSNNSNNNNNIEVEVKVEVKLEEKQEHSLSSSTSLIASRSSSSTSFIPSLASTFLPSSSSSSSLIINNHQHEHKSIKVVKEEEEEDSSKDHNSWKGIYKERMIIEQNWRQQRYVQRELSKNKNGVIYIQSCDALKTIMIGYNDNTIYIYNDENDHHLYNNNTSPSIYPTITSTKNENQIHPIILKMDSKIYCFQFDESKLIVGEENHTISIWDWRQQKKVRTLKGHSGPVVTLHFNPRNILVTGSTDNTIRVWDFQQSQSFTLTSSSFSSTIKSVQLLDQYPYLISTHQDDHTIKLWDISKKQCISELHGHYGDIQKLLPVPLLPSQHLLLPSTSSSNHHSSTSTQPKENPSIYSPFILSCSNDHTIRLWNIHSGQCMNTLFGHMDHVTCMACDDLRIVTGSKDGTIRIWSYNGDNLHVFHINDSVHSITLSSMGILYSCGEGNAYLFDYSG